MNPNYASPHEGKEFQIFAPQFISSSIFRNLNIFDLIKFFYLRSVNKRYGLDLLTLNRQN